MTRKVADCRDFPSINNCTLTISGEEEEVLLAAMDHAVSVHGHERNAQLRGDISKMLKDEVPGQMSGAPQPQPEAQPEAQPRH